ncbi:MAG: thiol reductant ABC exporter subunit CydD, partial [Actinomycetia bacterium]|nr:thiol reductant ABC exporter subunit CydD [Actinomycetes bacterium]
QATVLSRAIAHVFDTHNLDGVARDAALVIALFVGRGALTWLTSVLAHKASAAVKSQLRRDVMAAHLRNPFASRTPSGTLITVITHGLDALDAYYSKYLPQFILAGIVPVVMAVAVGFRDLTSLFIIVVTVPLIPVFMIVIGWTTQERVKRRFAVQSRLANYFADLVAGLPTLQVFGRARAQTTGLSKVEDANRTETMGTLRLAFLSAGVLEMVATLSVALVAVTIGFRVVDGGLDLNNALFILIIAPEVYLPIRMVGTHFHDSANGSAAADAAFAIIDAVPPAVAEAVTPATQATGSAMVSFRGVSYRYPPLPGAAPSATEEPLVLDEVSFDVAAGELVALAGPSGAGKSTVLGLALGFLRPTTGAVLAGGRDLAHLDGGTWRREVAWVGQEPGLLPGTVADNIALGHPGVPEAAMRHALDRVGGGPIALDHTVGDVGEGLSAGERRRVAMARALIRLEYGGARLAILDEPTAGLDQVAEATALAALRQSGVAVLVVSHRPAVLEIADRVIRVEPHDVVPAAEPEAVSA